MTAESIPAGDDPRRLLSNARQLARRVRLAQRATWFPLLALGVVFLGAIPIDLFGQVRDCQPSTAMGGHPPPGEICLVYNPVHAVYWPVAHVLAYALIAYWYLRVARERGLRGRVLPYVVTGIVVTIVMSAVALWIVHQAITAWHHQVEYQLPGQVWVWRLFDDGGVWIGLLVLAWLERHLALLVFALGYLAVMLIVFDPRFFLRPASMMAILGSALLLGAYGFFRAQRRGVERGGSSERAN